MYRLQKKQEMDIKKGLKAEVKILKYYTYISIYIHLL